MGQHRKKLPPTTNQTIFIQNFMSVKRVTSKHEKTKNRVAADFLGDFQA